MLSWIRLRVKGYVHRICQNNHHSLPRSDEEALYWKGKLAFSILMALLAWRQKRRLARLTKGMVATLLSPISELVEALAMPTNRQNSIQQQAD